jgi:hypothetical protein
MHRPPLPRAETSPSTTSHRRELSSSSTTNTNTAHAKKPTTIRPQRPAIHHRKSASAHYPAHNSARAQPQSIGRLLGPGTGPASWSAQNDDDDEKYEMATSFLQYWYVSVLLGGSMDHVVDPALIYSLVPASFLVFWVVVLHSTTYSICTICMLRSAVACHSAWLTFIYSAMCEKQITVPDDAVLYCSER